MSHWALGWTHRCRGEFEAARKYLKQVITWYDPQQHHFLTFIYAQDPGVVTRSQLSVVMWALGYPDRALELSQEALVLARELAHPFSVAFALLVCASVYSFRRNAPMCQKNAEELIDLSTEHGFMHWLALGNWFRGYSLILQEKVDEGIAQASKGIVDYQSTGAALDSSLFQAGLIEGYIKTGRLDEGTSHLADALAFVEETGERYGEAALHRLQAELLDLQGANDSEVERCLWKGIEIARRQRARSWELRVTTMLCRLWQKCGMQEKAYQLLAEIYNWFTEGFETEDLREARELLEEL
jgi:adenylate cyclase